MTTLWRLFLLLLPAIIQGVACAAFYILGDRRGQRRALRHVAPLLSPTQLTDGDGNSLGVPTSEVRVTFWGDAANPVGIGVLTFAGPHEASPEASRDLTNMAIGALERRLQEEDA